MFRYGSACVSALLILAVALAACASPAAPPTPTPPPEIALAVSGSGSVSTVFTAIKSDFETAVPGYTLNVLSGTGTGGGVKGVLDGTLDVAAMARAPKDDETAAGLKYLEFGKTAVAILLHPDVGVTTLTQAQVKAIFAGEITNWSEVGGPDLDIVLYVRDEDESATGALRKAIFGDTPFPETAAGVMTSAGDMLTAIESTPGSIGFGNWSGVLASDKKVAAAALDGIKPGEAEYAVKVIQGVGYTEQRQAVVQPLLDWLTSDAGQAVLQQRGVNPA